MQRTTTAPTTAAVTGKRRAARRPTLRREGALLASGHRYVAGMDEVGRGAWAGPLVVGLVVLDATTGRLPRGTRDSKALSRDARTRIASVIETWCAAWSLGESTAKEIDELGLSAALHLASWRAIRSSPLAPDAVLLDGAFDFIAPTLDDASRDEAITLPRVELVVRGDQSVGTIAAASILAKVYRDRLMAGVAEVHPRYGFERNCGYGTGDHEHAIAAWGVCVEHRTSWSFTDRILAPQEIEEVEATDPAPPAARSRTLRATA